ncbi:PREDICTED: nitric oxide-associated protein 1 [Papilio xuthus]|uniref:Nitric oxide-associated protein 1 n=1 Tax=Papilio xuthus TaxID=66420 RepID=A0AAJ7E889_PAPXU|nr:PREDICTED: nitric oxide-associated protein 1 [Papilio xuthus]
MRSFFRLYQNQSVIRIRVSQFVRKKSAKVNEEIEKTVSSSRFNNLIEEYRDKIKFNSYLDREILDLGYYKFYVKFLRKAEQIAANYLKEKSLPPLPVALKYIDNNKLLCDNIKDDASTQEKKFQLPFSNPTNINISPENQDTTEKTRINSGNELTKDFDRSNITRWMTNYEHFDDSKLRALDELEDDDIDRLEWSKNYGTPDPKFGISQVPCGGCGALLHCSDPAIPGYLPSEIIKGRTDKDLKIIECQRCHFLKEYNIALDVTVQPEEYEKLLQNISHVKSLVLLMVDLLDFPCSIWPGIVDIIGTQRPLIIVANKVDLLPGDSVGYLKRVKECLMRELNKTTLSDANIKHISLISAKTGYGVEELISAMFKLWMYKGDVFLVGCTNVGKSSLFNALLQSDYCKVHAVDIVKRATVSRWPGTTLNLLKFPINRPSGWKIQQRYQRLKSEAKALKLENEIRRGQVKGKIFSDAPSLIGHIGRTFAMPLTDDHIDQKQPIDILDEKHELFANSKWFYDTPGVIHPDQVLSLLSTEELLMTIPKSIVKPQTYYLQPGSTLFIAGLARMDFVDCSEPCRFTVFCSEHLPVTVVKTEDADEMYEKFLGTELFAVPTGGAERLKNWPGLKMGKDMLEFSGQGPKVCCGDMVLSSIGWISVTGKYKSVCKVAAWTPGARGIYKREPALLPYSINLKGKRIRDTPAYTVGKVYSDESS